MACKHGMKGGECPCVPGGCNGTGNVRILDEAEAAEAVGRLPSASATMRGWGNPNITYERAVEINNLICTLYYSTHGIQGQPNGPEGNTAALGLKDISLMDMLTASHMLKNHPGEEVEMRNGQKGRSLHVTCDDRFVAAVYAALHHDTDGRGILVVAGDECLRKQGYKLVGSDA